MIFFFNIYCVICNNHRIYKCFYVYVCMCVFLCICVYVCIGICLKKIHFLTGGFSLASPREVLLLLVLLLLLFELNVYSLHAASISWYSITYIQMTHSLHLKKTSASINKLICISDVPVWMINKNLQKWLKKGMSHDQIFQ